MVFLDIQVHVAEVSLLRSVLGLIKLCVLESLPLHYKSSTFQAEV